MFAAMALGGGDWDTPDPGGTETHDGGGNVATTECNSQVPPPPPPPPTPPPLEISFSQ